MVSTAKSLHSANNHMTESHDWASWYLSALLFWFSGHNFTALDWGGLHVWKKCSKSAHMDDPIRQNIINCSLGCLSSVQIIDKYPLVPLNISQLSVHWCPFYLFFAPAIQTSRVCHYCFGSFSLHRSLAIIGRRFQCRSSTHVKTRPSYLPSSQWARYIIQLYDIIIGMNKY